MKFQVVSNFDASAKYFHFHDYCRMEICKISGIRETRNENSRSINQRRLTVQLHRLYINQLLFLDAGDAHLFPNCLSRQQIAKQLIFIDSRKRLGPVEKSFDTRFKVPLHFTPATRAKLIFIQFHRIGG